MADGSPDQRIAVTSNEPVGEKHLVQPYDERPVVQPGGWRTCEYCGNPGFRRSRLRMADVPWVFLLHWPLRCTRCGQRQRAPLLAALMARKPRPHGGDAAVGPHSWGAWTGPAKKPAAPARTDDGAEHL